MAYSFTVEKYQSGPDELLIIVNELEVDPSSSVAEIDIGAEDRAITLCTIKSLINVAGGATTLWFGQLQYQKDTAAAPIYDQVFVAMRTSSDGKIYLKTKPDQAQLPGGQIITWLKIRYGWAQ
jgi:hypothetical protein